MRRLTNRELAEVDQLFRSACAAAGQFPSRTRYRKWKHGRGLAFQMQSRLVDKGIEMRVETISK